ncbi:histidine phosphatase family protein [Caballeronia sp. Lep1P3]|uniref:histidine phosphatase family protein n=1 Tax=Caballeronia sp. Lep1P3 TaxID=2878150 RepID=UPI001FD4C17D|nr:histidine phosphatase family protein [Caballeronia sp. Lep1P3]
MKFILLCHAATHAMRAARFPSPDDAVARDERATLAHLRARCDERVIASPAAAARATASWITHSFDIDPAFGDIDYGRWRGHSIRDMAESDPQGVAAWLSNVDARPHGGESIAMLAQRVTQALARLAREASCECCIVVTHAIVLKVALAHVRGEPLASIRSVDFAPLSSITLDYDAVREGWRVQETS